MNDALQNRDPDGAYNTESEDYFRFTAVAGRIYTIRSASFAALGGSTVQAALISPDGKENDIASILEENSDTDGNSFCRFEALSTGIYKIRLYNYSGRQISYSIGVFTDPPQEEQSYTVTYDPNGGAGAPANQRKTSDSRLRLSSVEPARPGYRFLGWGTSVGSTMPEYMPGDPCGILPGSDVDREEHPSEAYGQADREAQSFPDGRGRDTVRRGGRCGDPRHGAGCAGLRRP